MGKRGKRPAWTKETIPPEFKRLVDEGYTYMDFRRKKSGLLTAIQKLYGGIIPFCEEIGVDYTKIVSKAAVTRYKADNATKEDVDHAIKELFKDGHKNISDLEINIDTAWIVVKAKEVYGSWNNALRNNGIKPQQSYPGEIDRLVPEIIRLYNEGKSVREISDIVKVSESSIYDRLKDAGIDTYERYIATRGLYKGEEPPLSKETCLKIVRIIIKMSDSERFKVQDLEQEMPYEMWSIKHHFGSLAKAVVESGEYVLDKGVPRIWSKEFLLEQIRLGYRLGMPLNIQHMYTGYGTSAVTYARDTFGSWANAVDASGVGYDNVRLDAINLSRQGHKFESILDDLLTDLGIQYVKHGHEKYKPDYVVGNEWIDAKLSAYTYHGKDDDGKTVIDKYEPHCDKLTLIFLRGDKDCDRMITEKTRLVSVYKYVEKLPEELREKYIDRLTELEREIDEVKTLRDAV